MQDPTTLYAHVEEEGERRLSRPALELASTALVAGFDVVFGITALAITTALTEQRLGPGLAEVLGAVAFGVGFLFISAGRSELFTENFFVPIAGLDTRNRRSWFKLGELWLVSPIVNVVGGGILILVLSSEGVLPHGAGGALERLAATLDARDATTMFLSAIAAGALITLMTWIVEGNSEAVGLKLLVAWSIGSLLALGRFNHVIVVTLELLFGMRYGADVGTGDVIGNVGLAAVGNLVGGVLFVTLTRSGQARAR